MEEIVKEPLEVFESGQCPLCGGQLIAAETETTVMMLDKYGNPISEDTNILCRGICHQCATKFDMIRYNGRYTIDTWYYRMRKEQDIQQIINRRKMNLNKKKDDNPLSV